ncbi:hypothetical protein DWB92_09690 [Staphylococcus chromogenes]|uniref:hypothetical protein n=1 Tax=Staphylococcus chromogenes TaxID=46126 RepID=UPI000E686EAF|nr:hypothetical protein [Staphylococcus chromogenes]QDW82893.1 hypothetical protein DWB92_09690 [Staphylococcus chromogenes]RIM21426.1 hypothetical protein BU660_03850 [Staphylococcus chromogenes]
MKLKIRDLNIDDKLSFYVDEQRYEGVVTELIYNFKGKEMAQIELDNAWYYNITDDDDWEVIYD